MEVRVVGAGEPAADEAGSEVQPARIRPTWEAGTPWAPRDLATDSRTALVVLLGAIVLNCTYFGVLLVISDGLGMAFTLTSAGLLLAGGGSRPAKLGEQRLPALRRYTSYGAILTALAVLAVRIGLTVRGLL